MFEKAIPKHFNFLIKIDRNLIKKKKSKDKDKSLYYSYL